MKIVFYLLFISFICGIGCLDFVKIESSDPNISDFFVMETAITQELYLQVMGENPSFHVGERLPVENISWYEAIVFCNLLSRAHHLTPVYTLAGDSNALNWGAIPQNRRTVWDGLKVDPTADGYRLLSLKEWNYLFTKITSDSSYVLTDFAWVKSNSEGRTHPVGEKAVDSLGLYDFLGNVREWNFDDKSLLFSSHLGDDPSSPYYLPDILAFGTLVRAIIQHIPDKNGLYNVTKSPLVGLRIARDI
ncbi:MAG: formylglycine-generating enzyme family protein [Candidatus Cloacimonetes bacterium]|nr:formylglycine-generating enzyme family protein [Candidatus Cloacimonadota bacterium]